MKEFEKQNSKYKIKNFISKYLDLSGEKHTEEEVVCEIVKGIEFKGANLWILIFAIFMASLGLNVNSTAVIIGAMLISPLMEPIIGIGFSIGVNDFATLKRSFKSYGIATLFSIATATIFFLFSPIDEAQSELLARTSPTIYDVFIALFGGLAGAVALATNQKGNVIPGVAIATALMPPLCTAGFGLATGSLAFFMGALYLYFINSVFIALATFIVIHTMKFRKKVFIDKDREKTVRKYIIGITVVTLIPAVFLTLGIVRKTMFESAANRFINSELNFDNTQIISKNIVHDKDSSLISVVILGDEVSEKRIKEAMSKLPQYDLKKTKLVIRQGGGSSTDVASIKTLVLEDFYKNSEKKIAEQKQLIDSMNIELEGYRKADNLASQLVPELKILYPDLKNLIFTRSLSVTADSLKVDTITVAIAKFGKNPGNKDKKIISEWLKQRTGTGEVKLIIE